MIPQSFIQDLLNKLDIVEVVERYLPLKKAGANFVACCPFHQEKTPSFTVSPSKQFYHCFGCQQHGTAISFVMAYEAKDFVEAVEELARQRGLTVPTDTRTMRSGKQENLTEVLREAMNYYRRELKKNPRAIEYLKGRGLSGETAAAFGLGFAPSGWHNLSVALPDISPQILLNAGLLTENDSGQRYDRFRERIMFPILNSRGWVVGFGGRVLGTDEPKYLNSPETTLFAKGQELYGLFQARRAIHASGQALVVEGYMDVLALAQHGIRNVVATLGTATSTAHLQQLARLANDITFCFDGDVAGRKAAWRALEHGITVLSDTKQFRFLFLPDGEDPDSYVRKVGSEKFAAEVAQATPLSQFFLQELSSRFNLKTDEGRAGLLDSARPYLERMTAPALAMLLRRRLADLANIGEKDLQAVLPATSKSKVARPSPLLTRKTPASPTHTVIKAILARPSLAQYVSRDEMDENDVYGPVLREILEYLSQQEEQATSGAFLLQHLSETPHYHFIEGVLKELLEWDENFDIEAEFFGALAQLEAGLRQRRIDELRRQAGAMGWTPDSKRELQRLLQRPI